jgi:crossover junction endodeoxyribonuclease RusA
MNSLLCVQIVGDPKGQPRARAFSRGGRARMYDPGTAEAWKSAIAAHVRNCLPEIPHQCPLKVHMEFRFLRPKNHYSSKGELTKSARESKLHHTQKPDFDNLEKAVSDCLTELGFWRDDTQVVEWSGLKKWVSRMPGMFLKIDNAGGQIYECGHLED